MLESKNFLAMSQLPEATKKSARMIEKEAAALNVSDFELPPNWFYLFYFEIDEKFSKIPADSPRWPLDYKNSQKVSLMYGDQVDIICYAHGGKALGEFKYQGYEKDVNKYLRELCQSNGAAAREKAINIGCGSSQGSNRNDNNQNYRPSCSPEIGLPSSQSRLVIDNEAVADEPPFVDALVEDYFGRAAKKSKRSKTPEGGAACSSSSQSDEVRI